MAFQFFKKDNGHLAKTRKEQFGYILRNNIPTLFVSNVMMFLFAIPLIMTFIFFSISFHQLNLRTDTTSQQLFSLFLISGGLSVVSIFLLNLGIIGQYTIVKELVFNSTSKFSSFFKGIKNNFKDSVFLILFYSVIYSLLFINVGFFLYVEFNATFKLIVLIINISLCVLFILGKGYINFEIVVFKNKTSFYIRNGIYLFYKNLPMSFVELILILVPFITIAFVPINFVFIPVGILATCYLSFIAHCNFMISIVAFEKLFTPEQIPEIFHKGLEQINL